jgi:hypothetical protein
MYQFRPSCLVSVAHHAAVTTDPEPCKAGLWHQRLGHPGFTTMQRMLGRVRGLDLTNREITKLHGHNCLPCIKGKLVTRPFASGENESLSHLQRLHCDVHGPVDPPCGSFRYFLVIKDAKIRFSNVSLLSNRAMCFPRIVTFLLHLAAHYPNFPVSTFEWTALPSSTLGRSRRFARRGASSLKYQSRICTPRTGMQNP